MFFSSNLAGTDLSIDFDIAITLARRLRRRGKSIVT